VDGLLPELRKQHAEGHTRVGINVRHSTISDLTDENVLQPMLVTTSALSLATETVCMILKIDDMVVVR
jgi:T-complex protein 1 subunit delta